MCRIEKKYVSKVCKLDLKKREVWVFQLIYIDTKRIRNCVGKWGFD